LKVAIVHDWLTVNGGAERVLRAILELYPEADIFSLVDFLSQKDRETILMGKRGKTTFLQKLPFAKQTFRLFLPLFPKAVESLNLDGYDLVISSSYAMSKGVKTTDKQLHIAYLQARNMKYIWDESEHYFSGVKSIFRLFFPYLRKFDVQSAQKADYLITNSHFVRTWTKKRYGRDSVVIHPPVDVEAFSLCEEKEDYYIFISRLVPYKRIDIMIEAFRQMPDKKLIIIGDGSDTTRLKSLSSENIEFLGFLSTEQMKPLLERAKAFVFTSKEDFGIAPIEALACGTPVVAFGEGGVLDSVQHRKNGFLFYEQSPDALIDAIKEFEKSSFDYKTISNYAKIFSKKRFQDEFKSFVNHCIKERDV
jgi:glycosyltransferase involved in cell wall biosynthesis